MPTDMFGDVVDPSIKVGSQKWYTVPRVHSASMSLIVGGVIIVPLMADGRAADAADDDGVRRRAAAAATAAAPAAAAGGGCADADADQRQPERRAGRGAEGNRARRLPPPGPPSVGVPGGVVGGVPGGSLGGVVGGLPEAPPPPPPPPTAPVRVGGNIRAPTKLAERRAGLPADRAVGARPGHRHHRGDDQPVGEGDRRARAPLDPAARPGGARRGASVGVHARPLLNGVPVPVIMTVTVNFTLQS